ncbi:MAG: hotdog domain-containing protein [Bryobacteraceae bacterium]
MNDIPVGLSLERSILVTSELAIDFLGVEEARVFATPHLVWQLEMTCRNSIKPLVGEDYDSVGTDVSVRHFAATPLGMTVHFRSEVIHVDGNRVRFRVEAWDEKERVSEGTHERYVVHIPRFAARVRAKAAGQ